MFPMLGRYKVVWKLCLEKDRVKGHKWIEDKKERVRKETSRRKKKENKDGKKGVHKRIAIDDSFSELKLDVFCFHLQAIGYLQNVTNLHKEILKLVVKRKTDEKQLNTLL